MSQTAGQTLLARNKIRSLLPLPEPSFKKAKVTVDEEINDIMPPPEKPLSTIQPSLIINSKIPNELPFLKDIEIIPPSLSPPIKFIYQHKDLGYQFTSSYNFSCRTIFEITQLKTVEDILKLRITCKDLEPCAKLRSIVDAQEIDMNIFGFVCVIENAMNEVFIMFRNENQFDWGSYSTCENEYLIYKIMDIEKTHLLLNKPYAPLLITKPLGCFNSDNSELNKVAVSLFEFKSIYNKLLSLRFEVPLEQNRFEDRLINDTIKLNSVQLKANNFDFKKSNERLSKEIIEKEKKLEQTKQVLNESQKENDVIKKKIECQEDIFDKVTRSVLEAQQSLENEVRMKEELISQQREASSRISYLKEDIERRTQEKEVIKSKSTFENIDGRLFEEIGKELNINKEYESKLVILENQYEGSLCCMCMINQRDCLFVKCKHLFCCKQCVLSEINKETMTGAKKKKKKKKKETVQIKGNKMTCPYCNESNTKFLEINLR